MEDNRTLNVNYRKAGIIMTPFVLIGLTLAYFLGAPSSALATIAFCGLGCALILIMLGNRVKVQKM
ncbi:hypothetical protein F8154_13525 [Alkaliphilus pronyensis]|uniref:Uncharacterized protein n=1 Tax=Alkaliphilus pronyensis TaxID=1482732 RepID=A0A6I0F548_9FIRM|nr:hypothetical protein [Alkaliphilus pronyensis]KAB3530934.1 hypothetical protein F8154_13525 [Alkaliphilus pronyensis]